MPYTLRVWVLILRYQSCFTSCGGILSVAIVILLCFQESLFKGIRENKGLFTNRKLNTNMLLCLIQLCNGTFTEALMNNDRAFTNLRCIVRCRFLSDLGYLCCRFHTILVSNRCIRFRLYRCRHWSRTSLTGRNRLLGRYRDILHSRNFEDSRCFHSSLLIVEQLVILSTLDDSIPTTDILAFVLVDTSIGQAGILVALKLEDGIIHEVCIENAQRTKQLEVLNIKTSNLLEEARFQLRNNIFQGTLTIIGEIHKYRYTGSELDELLLNLFTHGFVFFFFVGEFLLLFLSLFAAFFLGFLNGFWNIQSFYIISYPSKSLWLSHSRFSEIHEYG
ncbi:hypothetical protein BN927_01468 [Lactococcus lactis subsp. lactis Dephy 1]|nr:hypothetical protein BN927_01468 [Lactococcus lactis subsp. lactis Dephy 1]